MIRALARLKVANADRTDHAFLSLFRDFATVSTTPRFGSFRSRRDEPRAPRWQRLVIQEVAASVVRTELTVVVVVGREIDDQMRKKHDDR